MYDTDKEIAEMKDMMQQITYMMREQMLMTKTLSMFIPERASISTLAEITGKTRQGILKYVKSNFLFQEDYWIENDKVVVSRDTAMQILVRRAK